MSIYQQYFKKYYSQVANKKPISNSWEHFVLGFRVYQWLSENDPIYTNTLSTEEVLDAIDEIFDIILTLLEMMKSPAELLTPVIYYANSFVKRAGIKHNQLFNLLLTSTIVTLKFWNESIPCHNKIMAEIFEFPVKDINLMERRFLSGVDYNLHLSQEDISLFLSKINITSTLKQSFKQFSNRFPCSSNNNTFKNEPIQVSYNQEPTEMIYDSSSSTTPVEVSPISIQEHIQVSNSNTITKQIQEPIILYTTTSIQNPIVCSISSYQVSCNPTEPNLFFKDNSTSIY